MENTPPEAVWTPAFPSPGDLAAAVGTSPDTSGTHRLVVAPGVVSTGKRPPERDAVRDLLNSTGEEPGQVQEPGTRRGRVQGWSAKSRSRMIRTLAELDYQPLFGDSTRLPAMITLTLPGDWVTVAPDAATFKALVRRWQDRWRYQFGEKPVGVWKMEFQRRGAPHLHALMSLPPGFTSQWLSQTWADVVAHPDPQQYAWHLLAGTGVDVAQGLRSYDSRRLSLYFSKHGTWAHKAYQDEPPAEWEGQTGRIWGYWGLTKATAEMIITDREAVQVQRLLRRRQHAQAVRVQRRVRRLARPELIDPDTGEILREATYRYRMSGARMGSGRRIGAAGAGYQVVNDGAATGADIARYVQLLRGV